MTTLTLKGNSSKTEIKLVLITLKKHLRSIKLIIKLFKNQKRLRKEKKYRNRLRKEKKIRKKPRKRRRNKVPLKLTINTLEIFQKLEDLKAQKPQKFPLNLRKR